MLLLYDICSRVASFRRQSEGGSDSTTLSPCTMSWDTTPTLLWTDTFCLYSCRHRSAELSSCAFKITVNRNEILRSEVVLLKQHVAAPGSTNSERLTTKPAREGLASMYAYTYNPSGLSLMLCALSAVDGSGPNQCRITHTTHKPHTDKNKKQNGALHATVVRPRYQYRVTSLKIKKNKGSGFVLARLDVNKQTPTSLFETLKYIDVYLSTAANLT